MIDFDKPVFHRFGKNKEVFVLSSLVLDNPSCEMLFAIASNLQDVVNEINEIARDKI